MPGGSEIPRRSPGASPFRPVSFSDEGTPIVTTGCTDCFAPSFAQALRNLSVICLHNWAAVVCLVTRYVSGNR